MALVARRVQRGVAVVDVVDVNCAGTTTRSRCLQVHRPGWKRAERVRTLWKKRNSNSNSNSNSNAALQEMSVRCRCESVHKMYARLQQKAAANSVPYVSRWHCAEMLLLTILARRFEWGCTHVRHDLVGVHQTGSKQHPHNINVAQIARHVERCRLMRGLDKAPSIQSIRIAQCVCQLHVDGSLIRRLLDDGGGTQRWYTAMVHGDGTQRWYTPHRALRSSRQTRGGGEGSTVTAPVESTVPRPTPNLSHQESSEAHHGARRREA